MTRYDDDLALALRMADEADAISMARFGAQDLEISTKADTTHVTDADRAVERRIRAILAEERPDDGILGEEYGTEDRGGSTERQWIVDPIDGTAHFLRGAPIWATLIALAVDGRPVVGVVSSPALGARWWAAEGSGAWTDPAQPRRLRVSRVAGLSDAVLSYNAIQGWDGAGRIDQLIELQREVWRARSYGDAWSYMLLAEGKVDAVAEFDLKPYDMAALVPVIEEAGGRFTSAEGLPGPWHGSALATNGALHEQLLERLAR
ncbi:histidinol-phosphatase [Agrococcus sp. HG114]|uniref:histidinol-phosphatase n=1 Tax=Agrococcus sp. HG114 TaxID=2969757 RepID=UPI00215ADCF2|nr:histidinol-phosphatase [Agrococcus sp. HG114]MCR8670978.1 histidinol-phosphatase [Agrococcus sp. HG114]